MSKPKKPAKDVFRLICQAFGSRKRAAPKGGDGGQAAAHTRATRHVSANEKVYLNAVDESEKRACIPTRDNSDRAHGAFGPDGMLIPAATRDGRLIVKNSKSRKYPLCQINGKGVSIDSAYDETFLRQQWLVQEGLLAGTTKGIRYDCNVPDEFMPKVRRRPVHDDERASDDGKPANDQ